MTSTAPKPKMRPEPRGLIEPSNVDVDPVMEPSTMDAGQAEASSRPGQKARKRGRPKVAEASVRVSTWLPIPYFDQLERIAKERDESISSLIRSLLMLRPR